MAELGGGSGVKEFAKDAAIAAFGSFALDLFVEATGIPMLNERSPIQLDPTHESTTIETILTGAGLVGVTLGGLSVFAGKPIIGGFGKQALAYGAGVLIGESFYENQAVKWLGIRNIRHPIYK